VVTGREGKGGLTVEVSLRESPNPASLPEGAGNEGKGVFVDGQQGRTRIPHAGPYVEM